MRNFILEVFVLLSICMQEEKKGVKFEEGLNWKEIKSKAQAENRYIFLDVYATWCIPCKKMDNEVYSNDSVGSHMNDKFISVKIQWDSTKQDNEKVRSWYEDVHKLSKEYNIDGLPCFLFFDPSGQLVHKDLGYKNAQEFIKTVDVALDPESQLYYLRLDEYKRGKKIYSVLRDLAKKTKDFGNKVLAKQIARDYINSLSREQLLTIENIYFIRDIAENRELAHNLAVKYKEIVLDKLGDNELCTREIVWFMNDFSKLISTKDNFFKLCYYQPAKLNELIESENWALSIVEGTIRREEIANKVVRDNKPLFKNPDWSKIQMTIENKYPKVDAKYIVLNYQVSYYRNKDLNWFVWAKCVKKKIAYSTLKQREIQTFIELNLPAWDAFLHCNERNVLIDALGWIDLAIKLEAKPIAVYIDTKANLLYKLGNVKEAIDLERKGLLLDPNDQEIKENLIKMEKHVPTWIE